MSTRFSDRGFARALTGSGKDALTRDELLRAAPSVFATGKHHARSEKYLYIPTINVVERLASEGWLPTRVIEQRVRTEDRKGFQKHSIRFRKYDGTEPVLRVGDSFVEMILQNAHDGTSAYKLDAGIFRLICTNGLVVADAQFASLKFKHKGFAPDDVLEASYRVLDAVPQLQSDVQAMQSLTLSPQEQRVFAEAASELRFSENSAPRTEEILKVRRKEDMDASLWVTYNRAQENIVERGGLRQPPLRYTDELGIEHIRHRTSRPIKGIDQNTSLNKALWTLAEKMREIKEAA